MHNVYNCLSLVHCSTFLQGLARSCWSDRSFPRTNGTIKNDHTQSDFKKRRNVPSPIFLPSFIHYLTYLLTPSVIHYSTYLLSFIHSSTFLPSFIHYSTFLPSLIHNSTFLPSFILFSTSQPSFFSHFSTFLPSFIRYSTFLPSFILSVGLNERKWTFCSYLLYKVKNFARSVEKKNIQECYENPSPPGPQCPKACGFRPPPYLTGKALNNTISLNQSIV